MEKWKGGKVEVTGVGSGKVSWKWEVGSGKWKVGSGKWEVGSGKWPWMSLTLYLLPASHFVLGCS
ncbi:MAG: hypothetical protein FJW23_08325 [Acidimicrobiia bacterium]|nr:hypothetical protein [Acidimicrobiia bacterium]